MVGKVEIPTPVVSPTVFPVTPIATGLFLLTLPADAPDKYPKENLPLWNLPTLIVPAMPTCDVH